MVREIWVLELSRCLVDLGLLYFGIKVLSPPVTLSYLGCLCNLGGPWGLVFPHREQNPEDLCENQECWPLVLSMREDSIVMQLRSPYVSSGFREGWIWGVQAMFSCFLCFASTLSLSHFALQSTSLFWLLESGFIFRYVLVRSSAPCHCGLSLVPNPHHLLGALFRVLLCTSSPPVTVRGRPPVIRAFAYALIHFRSPAFESGVLYLPNRNYSLNHDLFYLLLM